MKKVTKEIKQTILESRKKGLSFAGIGKVLNLSTSTVQYHCSEEQRQKAIIRAIKNSKTWAGKKEYNRKYHAERYKNDPEYRKRIQVANRENWRKKHGKSNNLS